MRYNCTSFYDSEEVKATFGIIQHKDFKPNEEAIQAWNEYKAEQKQQRINNKNLEEVVYENCVVKWGKSGFDRRVRYYEEHGCKVVVKGQQCSITLPDGSQMYKRQGAKYFEFYVEENSK